MFYDIDVAPGNGRIFGGGAQDNGSLVAGVTATEGDFLHVLDGDGAWMVFDPEDETHVYGSRSDIHIFRHTAARHWSAEFWEEISPKAMQPDEHHQNAIAVLAIDPARPRTRSGWVRAACGVTTDERARLAAAFRPCSTAPRSPPSKFLQPRPDRCGPAPSAAASSAASTTARPGRAIFPGPRFPRA